MNKSKIELKSKLLYKEFTFYDDEYKMARIIAKQIPNRIFYRIINKFRRIRNAPEIHDCEWYIQMKNKN